MQPSPPPLWSRRSPPANGRAASARYARDARAELLSPRSVARTARERAPAAPPAVSVSIQPLPGPGRTFETDEALVRAGPLIAGAGDADAAFTDAVLRDYLLSWQHGFEREQSSYKSFVVFAEIKLRQVLLATSRQPQLPSSQRLAAVLDCLDRMSALFGRYGPILHVCRHELLRALYVDFDDRLLGAGAAAYALRTPYFARAAAAERELVALRETMAAWERERVEGTAQSRAWEGIVHGLGRKKEAQLGEQLNELRVELNRAADERYRDPRDRLLEMIGSRAPEQRAQLAHAVLRQFGAQALRALPSREQADAIGALLGEHEASERAHVLGVVLGAHVPAAERLDLVGALADASPAGSSRAPLALAIVQSADAAERSAVLRALFDARPVAGAEGKAAALHALLGLLEPAERALFLSAALHSAELPAPLRRQVLVGAAISLEQAAHGGSQAELLATLLASARADARASALVDALGSLPHAQLDAVLRAVGARMEPAAAAAVFCGALEDDGAREAAANRLVGSLGWEAKERVAKETLRSVQLAAVIPDGATADSIVDLASAAFGRLSDEGQVQFVRRAFARRVFHEPSLATMMAGLRTMGLLRSAAEPALSFPRAADAPRLKGVGMSVCRLSAAVAAAADASAATGARASAAPLVLAGATEASAARDAELARERAGEGNAASGREGARAPADADSDSTSSTEEMGEGEDENGEAEAEEDAACEVDGDARTEMGARRTASDVRRPSARRKARSAADRAALRAQRAVRNAPREADDDEAAVADGVPVAQLVRMIADVYDKKAAEDEVADARGRARMALGQFVKDFLMRQYGVRSMASRSLLAITAATRRWGGEGGHARVRAFGLMSGLLTGVSWAERKTNFYLRALVELCARSGGIARVLADAKAAVPYDAARAAISALVLDRDARREMHELARTAAFVPHAAAPGAGGAAPLDGAAERGGEERVSTAGSGGGGRAERSLDASNSKRALVFVDDVALALVRAWEEGEASDESLARSALLRVFEAHDADGNGLLSFDEFVHCVHACTPRAVRLGRERLLDLYDEAIQRSAELTGAESDLIEPQAFCEVMHVHGLFERPHARFVEPAADAARAYDERRDGVGAAAAPGGHAVAAAAAAAVATAARALPGVAAPHARTDGAAGGARHGACASGALLALSVPSDPALLAAPAPPPTPAALGAARGAAAPRLGLGIAWATFGGMASSGPVEAGRAIEHVPKSEASTARLRDALSRNFLFRNLPAALLEECVHVLKPTVVAKGSRIARQGERADFFFVVEEGRFDALTVPAHRLPAVPHTAAAAAAAAAAAGGGSARRARSSRGAASGRRRSSASSRSPSPASPAPSSNRDAERPTRAELDLEGATLVDSYAPVVGEPLPCFGELSLLYAKPRAATVVARTSGLVWSLDRVAFRTIQSLGNLRHEPGEDGYLKRLLANVPLLKALASAELRRLSGAAVYRSYEVGDYVAKQGDCPADGDDALVVVLRGRARAVRRAEGPEEAPNAQLALEAGGYFGAEQLLGAAPREASVIAVSHLSVACFSRAAVEEAVGSIRLLVVASGTARAQAESGRRELAKQLGVSRVDRASVAFSRRVVELRGAGSSGGGVYNGRHLSSGVRLTLVALAKAALARSAEREALCAQVALLGGIRAALGSRESDADTLALLPPLLNTFHDASHGFLLFEGWQLCPLSDLPVPLDEAGARFVAACVALLLRALHDGASTLCRGINAAELYVGEDGRVRPLLLRHAKRLDGPTYTVCGAKSSLSPEQIRGEGHGFGADEWALGALLFELLTARAPFAGENTSSSVGSHINLVGDDEAAVPVDTTAAAAGLSDAEEVATYERILAHRAGALRPRLIALRLRERRPAVSDACADCIEALMAPDAAKRLGGANGPSELLAHPWLRDFDWGALAPGAVGSPLLDEALKAAERAARAAFAASQPPDAGLGNEPYEGDDLDSCFELTF